MNKRLLSKCELLVKNKEIIQNTYKWDDKKMALAGSFLFTSKMKEVSEEKLKECEEIFKDNTSIFSNFRGNLKLPLLCKMALSDNPEEYMCEVKETYNTINEKKWFRSEYTILSAMAICDNKDNLDKNTCIDRAKEIYDKMKKEHIILTSDEDIPFATMLAMADCDVDSMICDMEECYDILKKKFSDKNAVQAISHVLATTKSNISLKCNRVVQIYEKLAEANHKYPKGCELSTLAALALSGEEIDELVKEICEVDDYLKKQRGFGCLSIDKATRRMYAALMVLNEYTGEAVKNSGSDENIAMSVTLNNILATQICVAVVIGITMSNALQSSAY